jgi:hypothetical protein
MKSWADYKRNQRARQKARTPEGRLLVTGDNIARSLVDAIAEAVRSGTIDTTISDLIATASHRFPIPLVAEAAIKARLATRKSRAGGPSND